MQPAQLLMERAYDTVSAYSCVHFWVHVKRKGKAAAVRQ